jgi:hypothetical protein
MHRAGTWRGSESFVFAVLEATKVDLKQKMFKLINDLVSRSVNPVGPSAE